MSEPAEKKQEPRRCPGETESGRCKVPEAFLLPDGFCLLHSPSPEYKAVADAARVKGGLRTAAKHARAVDLDSLPPLDGPRACAAWAEEVARATATGQLPASKAQAVARLLSEWRSAFNAGEMQERLEELERRVRVRAVKP